MADTDETTPARANGTSHDAAPATRSPRRSAANAARNTARRVRARTEPEVESLEDQVQQLQTDLRSITSTLNRMGQTAGSELKSSANAQAEDLKARGQSAINFAQDEFGAFEKQIKDTIREKPLTAVVGAVAVGFILAVMTR